MSKVLFRRSFVVALTVLLLTALMAVTYARHSWRKFHWARQSNPFTIKLGDNLTGTWGPYLSVASADWSQSLVMDTNIVAGSTDSNCDPTLGRVEVCNGSYGQNGWLGIASIWTSGQHITQGTTKMNDTYFNMAQYNTSAWRQFVVCQEVGHTFGLDHQDERFSNTNLGSCMDYTNDPDGGGSYGASNLHPNQHDYDQLESIYSHLDSSTTVGASTSSMPPAMANAALDGPRQWGKEIRVSPNGRSSIFELDFGAGHKIYTFVIWADPEEHRGGGQH